MMRQYKTFKRYFTNYGGFGNFKDILFLDSLAVMVQDFLYTNKESDDEICYRLDGYIYLYDFMSLVVSVIYPMFHELGLSAIKDFIHGLQQERSGYNESEIEYLQDETVMAVYNASDRLIIPLLWTAYIYANARYIVEKDEEYKNATTMYYSLIFENSYYCKELTKEAYPIKCSKEATQMLINHIGKKCNEQLRKDEMTKDNCQAENKEKTEMLNKIRELESEIEEKNEQIEIVRNREKGISLGINQAQTALFGLSLANILGFNYTNKKKELAPMLHKIFGWGEAKIAAYLSTPCDNDERDRLAALFKVLSPELYATIMNRGELPPEVTPYKEKVTHRKG